ncbi:hypothetical protein [Kitasatospora sp. NPDC092286]|uniref:hypothetical protein n=1 Tax=Kitasatospora sp. NPDC092286 TaxID=3364087 RepID=UPI003819B8E5
MATYPDLTDWQIDLAGVVIGHGTPVLIEDIDGPGTPDKRSTAQPIPGEDGSYPGRDLLGVRTLRIQAGIRTPGDPAAALDLFAQLEATADSPVRLEPGATDVLRIRRPGRPASRLFGRVASVRAVSMARAVHGWIPVHITFEGLDPAWYADEVSGVNLPLDTSNRDKEGFTAPLRAPLTAGTADPESRPGRAVNNGNRPSWPTIRITGPVVNPKVWIEGHPDAVLEFEPLALGDSEWIGIETRPGTRWVTRNGQGSAAGLLTRRSRLDAFAIPPGLSDIRWSAQDATNTSRLSVTWRSASTSL